MTPSSQDVIGVCFVGLMTGKHKGFLTSQGLIVSDRLATAGGYAVLTTSAVRNRYLRLLDIAGTLFRSWRRVDIQCLEIYGGPSFVMEDMASAVGKLLGHKIVMVLHGGALPTFVDRYPTWTRRVLKRADALVTPSAYLQRAVAARGFSARVIPNVVDLGTYPYKQRRRLAPRLFWMRSFHPIWNPAMAVRMLALVRRQVPDATLVLAGQDKGSQHQTERLAVDLGVAGAVRFPGFLDEKAKIAAFRAADVFVNTNRIDNMPVSVVEACAMGLPVVSTRVGGIPDLLVDGETGLLVPDDDAAAMAEAVLRLLRDEELAARLSANGRCLAELSEWTRVRPQWDRLFSELRPSPRAAVTERAI